MTQLNELYSATKVQLNAGSIKNASIEARRIICHIANLNEDVFITHPNIDVEKSVQAQIENIIERRLRGEPLSKIIGKQEFWGLPFIVTKDTLDPRADTETLIECVLQYCEVNSFKDKPLNILDLGTGTGCILIALLSELPKAIGVGVDYSLDAAAIATQNVKLNNLSNRIAIVNANWMDAIDLSQIDIIVSNPPYIRDDVIANLSNEVKNHDPILALSGGQDGLVAYKKIINTLKNEKNLRAQIFFEIGYDQLEGVTRLVDDSNLCVRDSKRDLSGNNRVIQIACGDK